MREDLNPLLNEVLGGLAPIGAKTLINENIYAKLQLSNSWFVVCEGDHFSSSLLTLYIASPKPLASFYAVWALMKVFEELKGVTYGAPTLSAQCDFLVREAPSLFTVEQEYSAIYHDRYQWNPSSAAIGVKATSNTGPSDSPVEVADSSEPTPLVPPVSSSRRITLGQYIVLHWRGRLPLAVSYWVNSSLLSLLAYMAIGAMAEVLRRNTDLSGSSIGGLAMVLVLTIFIWGSVGTWRAGTAYDLNSRWPLGACAKLVLLIATVRLVYSWT